MNDKRYLLLPAVARVMVSQFSDVITYKTIGIKKVACEASLDGGVLNIQSTKSCTRTANH